MKNTGNKLTEAQTKALRDIGQVGGHGYGEYSGLGRLTVEALARKGLVTLGRRTLLNGKRVKWAITAGTASPFDFQSLEEIGAADNAAMARINARIAADKEARVVEILAACKRAEGETDEAMAARLEIVGKALRATNDATLAAAEKGLGL